MRRPSSGAYSLSSPRRSVLLPTWPPSPTVEDVPEPRWGAGNGEPPFDTRGAVDQESLLDDIPQAVEDQRFVLLSKQSAVENSPRRTSGAEQRRMARLQTDVDESPVFSERISTPYAYSKPQKELTTPSSAEHVPDVFDDSDVEPEDTAYLRTERKPARYSFVNSDRPTEDFRTNLRDTECRPELKRHDSGQRTARLSSSPRVAERESRPSLAYPESITSSCTSSGPSSPTPDIHAPKLVTRESSLGIRPSSREHTRPASPEHVSSTTPTTSRRRMQVADADWHSTYPPAIGSDRKVPLRYARHETIPGRAPRINIKSPSPSRPPRNDVTSLPYPMDDDHTQAFMPPEEHYQFDHAKAASPKETYPDSPKATTASMPTSPRLRETAHYPSRHSNSMPDESSYVTRSRSRSGSSSLRSQPNPEDRCELPIKRNPSPGLDKPLPSCPRSTPSCRYNDWYGLQGYQGFDICPSCFDGVFADTPFAIHFSQTRQPQRPVERFCDFSSPWMRLAWLLTVKQRRSSLDLLYALADIADAERPCPDDRELGSDRIVWYGIADQKDGVHVANFAVCLCDKLMIEALFPSMRGYLTKLPLSRSSERAERYVCSLRTSSRRFPKYLDLLVELDAEAQSLHCRPNVNRFIQLARDNAFKGECGKDKCFVRKPWHFIPSLPQFTVCEECYDLLVWPAIRAQSSSHLCNIPGLFNKSIQLVPGEEADVGSSCCLYSPRMRRVWSSSVQNEDFTYLKRKVVERKRAESRLVRERKTIVAWMVGYERGSGQWDRAKSALKELEKEWAAWE